jgi:hypothetical protein
MEVREIVNYYINETLHTLEVTFKTNNDNDDELRVDQVDLNEAENFGFLFTKTNVEDLYEDLNLDEDVFDIDEDEDGNDIIVIRYCRGDKKSLRKLTEKGRILMYDKYGYDFSDDKQDTLSTMRGYFGDK